MRLSLRAGLVLLLTAAAAIPATAQQPPAQPRPAQQPQQRPAAPAPQPRVSEAERAAQAAAAAKAQADSLAERVQQAEEAIKRLQQQLTDQAQATVQSRLRSRVEISGLILVNGFYNGAKMNAPDVPGWVSSAQDTTGLPNGTLGGGMRQTRLGFTVSGVRAVGADLGGDLQLDFFGGTPQDAVGRFFSPPRIRTASVRLDWPHIGLLVGQEAPLVSQQNPVSFAQIGKPGFWGAGNLWLWTPQARLTFEFGNTVRFGLQGAALDPVQTSQEPYTSLLDANAGEKSGKPSVEGRLYVDWGSDETESMIGIGAHRGWIATTGPELSSQAVTADFRVVFGAVAIAGEWFTGQMLAGLGDGGIAQNIGPQGQPVRTKGGWVQLDVRLVSGWEFGGGYGMDNPNDTDLLLANGTLPPAARLNNVEYEGHLHFRPGGGLLIGAEFLRLQTTYPVGAISANHVSFFTGIAF